MLNFFIFACLPLFVAIVHNNFQLIMYNWFVSNIKEMQLYRNLFELTMQINDNFWFWICFACFKISNDLYTKSKMFLQIIYPFCLVFLYQREKKSMEWQKNLLPHVYSSSIFNSEETEKPKCSFTDRWIKNMWYMQTCTIIQ